MQSHYFIHVGKCGGTSIRTALFSKEMLKRPTGLVSDDEYEMLKHTAGPANITWCHCHKPDLSDTLPYYVCLRNPIDRFVSAFNWVYYRVITPTYEPRLHKSYVKHHPTVEDFAFYDNDVNKMAEQLYDNDGALNEKACSIIRRNQMSWNINFYLEELLKSGIKITGVIAFPTLEEDAKHHFGVELGYFKKNQLGNKTLSKLGYKNLRKYLDGDFRCIQVIYDQGGMTEKQFNDLNVCYSAPP